MLTAQMIWSAESVPVPLNMNGSQSRIASSSDGRNSTRTPDLHAVFVREFSLEEVPSSALILLFSYTRYRLYINGVYCGRGPSRFQNQRPEYDTRDISKALRSGKNVVAVLVHRDAPTGRIMRHDPGFAAALQIGTGSAARTIVTDSAWISRPDRSFGPRNTAWASIEENIDARNGIDLTDPDLSLAGWSASIPVAGPEFFPVWPRTTPLQMEKLREWSVGGQVWPVILEQAKELVLDLPEIIQGYHNLEMDAQEGSELEIAYLLPEGAKSGKNAYTARRGLQSYMGGDTFAFNRLSLRLNSGSITITKAAAVEVRYPFERAGSFECCDPMLSRLWRICARSLELLSEDSYVDCADRERVEWTDDSPPAFDCTRVMMLGPAASGKEFWGDNRLLKALLRRIALTQQPDGQIKAHSCSERWDIHAIMEDRSCDWVIQLREYFDSSDDKALVKELWPALTRLMQWFLDRRTARGLVLAREWEVWDNPLRYQVCEGAGLNAFVYRAFCDASYLGSLIGESAAQNFAASAQQLRSDFNSLLWNADEGTYDGALFGPGSKTNEQMNGRVFPGPIVNGRYQPTAQGSLFALYCGIVPDARIASVRRWTLAHLDQITGPMSHYFLFDLLYCMQQQDHDREVLERIRAGWKHQVDSPWQTTWEDLHGGSKAHIYGMVPGYFLTAFVLGARRVGPVSDRSILIEPRCADLQWARGVAVTEFGPVRVDWQKSVKRALTIECSTPYKTKTTLRLYLIDGKESVLIDGQSQRAKRAGDSIEMPLKPGKHVVHYPAGE
jgi:hypothetical protein